MKAVITGGDSGIGRAVAIAYAREGADVVIAYLSETDDAKEVRNLVEKEGRRAVLISGDLQEPEHCRAVIKKAVDELGGIDILVNNAAHQVTCPCKVPPGGVRVRPSEGRTNEASQVYGRADYWGAARA
jgi:NAD(P)-dependent dehydrogenase (short-subunit alcohol dehydrogenase family)